MSDANKIDGITRLRLELEAEKILVDALFALVKGIYGPDFKPLTFDPGPLPNKESRAIAAIVKERYAAINAIQSGGADT